MDLLLSRYNSSVLDLDIEIGMELAHKAYEKEFNNKLWQRWLVDYKRMDNTTFIGFEEYKNKLMKSSKTNIDKMSKSETQKQIVKRSEGIIAAWKKEHEKK